MLNRRTTRSMTQNQGKQMPQHHNDTVLQSAEPGINVKIFYAATCKYLHTQKLAFKTKVSEYSNNPNNNLPNKRQLHANHNDNKLEKNPTDNSQYPTTSNKFCILQEEQDKGVNFSNVPNDLKNASTTPCSIPLIQPKKATTDKETCVPDVVLNYHNTIPTHSDSLASFNDSSSLTKPLLLHANKIHSTKSKSPRIKNNAQLLLSSTIQMDIATELAEQAAPIYSQTPNLPNDMQTESSTKYLQ